MGIFKLLFGFSDQCSACETEVKRGASFCPQCGERMPGARVVCPACGKELKGSAKFCSQCAERLGPKEEPAAPADKWNRWKRPTDEFARRIEAADLNAVLQPGLVVEPGTKALIFQGGALAATVAQGTFDLTRPLSGVSVATPATAILIDEGDTGVSLLYSGLRSREDVPVDAIVEVTVGLADPMALYTNLMHGRESLAIAELANMLWSAGANVIQARLRDSSVGELDGNLQLKADLERDLRTHMDTALGRNGLRLIDLRFLDFKSPMYDKIRQRRAETFLAQEEIADIEQRATLNRRLRETLTSDRMHAFTTAKDFEAFVRQTEHELGLKQVIRDAEMEELNRTYENKRDDAEMARKHLLEKLDLEHELAKDRLRWSGEKEQLDHRLQQLRKALDVQQQAEWSKFQQKLQKHGVLREEGVKDAKAKAEEVRIKMGVAGEALDLRAKRAAQEHDEELQRIHREQEEKDRETKRRMDERDQAARHEQEKIRALSEVEQARLAADLKKTEVFKEMSEDQILALMAKDSPHVAAAIAERARAQAQTQAGMSAEVKALYEKILLDKDSQRQTEADRLERMMSRAMDAMERVATGATAREREQKEDIKGVVTESMDRLSEVAVAKASSGRTRDSGDTAPAAPRSAPPAASPVQVVCPNCQHHGPAGSKFCENCGHQFFK